LEDYLRAAYVQQGAKMSDIERALDASYPAIRGDLERMGVPVRHHRERRV
jgi:hypothetical protein